MQYTQSYTHCTFRKAPYRKKYPFKNEKGTVQNMLPTEVHFYCCGNYPRVKLLYPWKELFFLYSTVACTWALHLFLHKHVIYVWFIIIYYCMTDQSSLSTSASSATQTSLQCCVQTVKHIYIYIYNYIYSMCFHWILLCIIILVNQELKQCRHCYQ